MNRLLALAHYSVAVRDGILTLTPLLGVNEVAPQNFPRVFGRVPSGILSFRLQLVDLIQCIKWR